MDGFAALCEGVHGNKGDVDVAKDVFERLALVVDLGRREEGKAEAREGPVVVELVSRGLEDAKVARVGRRDLAHKPAQGIQQSVQQLGLLLQVRVGRRTRPPPVSVVQVRPLPVKHIQRVHRHCGLEK